MSDERFDKYQQGARSAIDVVLWNVQQLIHIADTVEQETLAKQVQYTICSADTILQLCEGLRYGNDEDDDEDDEEEEYEED